MDYKARFGMAEHAEGGAFALLDAEDHPGVRSPHGVIYYTLSPGEHADFHRLDCDEYWLYHDGSDLEIWIYDTDGTLQIKRLGLSEKAQPCILIKAGQLFGAKHAVQPSQQREVLLSCVTVPRFSYDHYELLRKDEMISRYPCSASFFAM